MTDLFAPQAAGQLTAAAENADGTSDVYLTGDPAQNVVTLTLSNGLSGPVVFPPGTPVADDKLPSGQSAVYVYLNGLIGNDDIASIEFAAPGWAAASFTAANGGLAYLVIAPARQVTLPPGGTLSFRLTHLLVQGAPRSGTADVGLAGATGVTPIQSDVPLYLSIVNPPRPGKHPLGLQIGFDNPAVYTGQPQSLTLHLVNGGDGPLVPGGTDDWHGVTPAFQLTLAYGDGAGALTTIADAASITVDLANAYGNVWRAPQRRTEGQSPYWILQPDSNGGGTVLGTGERASIEFTIDGIEATLPAGLNSALTLAYLSWHDVPGYNDGATALVITKKAGPRVTTFTANPAVLPPGGTSLQTVLSWDTEHASGVRFRAPGVPEAQTFWTSGSGPIEGGITVPAGTTVTITAYKDIQADASGSGVAARTRDEVITASKRLRISPVARTDVAAGIGSIGRIVIPAASGSAFLFQMNIGQLFRSALSKVAILDLSSRAITGTLDLHSVLHPSLGDIEIHDAVPSPDGRTIHVLAVAGVGTAAPQLFVAPLRVTDKSYGEPVPVAQWDPQNGLFLPGLLPARDGRTVYVHTNNFTGPQAHAWALDTASYAVKGSWSWRPEEDCDLATPAASNEDGSRLLIAGIAGLTIIDVPGGFTQKATMDIGQLLRQAIANTLVSPDATRAYFITWDPRPHSTAGSLLAIDVNLAAATLTVAHDIPLTQPPNASASTLSADGSTLYLVTANDTLTAFDTATFAATTLPCGVNGQFTPLVFAAGTQHGVFYSSGHDNYSDDTVAIFELPQP